MKMSSHEPENGFFFLFRGAYYISAYYCTLLMSPDRPGHLNKIAAGLEITHTKKKKKKKNGNKNKEKKESRPDDGVDNGDCVTDDRYEQSSTTARNGTVIIDCLSEVKCYYSWHDIYIQ